MTAEWKETTEEIKNIMCRNVPSRDCDDCKYVGCSETKLDEFRQVANASQRKLLDAIENECTVIKNGVGVPLKIIESMLKELK